MHVVHFVYFNQVFEQHENNIAEQTSLPAKVCILELLENKYHQLIIVFSVFNHLWGAEGPYIIGNLLHTFSKDVGFVGDVAVKLDVAGVHFRDISVHLDVVGLFFCFVWVRLKKMLFWLQVFVYFAVYLDILERAMENNNDLSVDGPIIKVGNKPFKNEFKGAKWTNLVFVFAIQTLEQIYE